MLADSVGLYLGPSGRETINSSATSVPKWMSWLRPTPAVAIKLGCAGINLSRSQQSRDPQKKIAAEHATVRMLCLLLSQTYSPH